LRLAPCGFSFQKGFRPADCQVGAVLDITQQLQKISPERIFRLVFIEPKGIR
jgi:hypothetical protein